jgi:PAS domain-containing protein
VFVVDGDGDLVYFNEPAEGVLGRSFADVRSMPFEEWTIAFAASHDGEPVDPAELPLAIAVRRREPSTSQFEIVDAGGQQRRISASAFPLIGQNGRLLGAVAMFWEIAKRA